MKRIIVISGFLLFFLALSPEVLAQCAMCKMSPQSNLSQGGTSGSGLNAGILYMLAMPYLLVTGLGIVWYVNKRKEESIVEEKN